MSTLKQAFRGWLMLLAAFLAGASAGSLGQGLYWRLFASGNVERHQAMLANQGAYFTRVKIDRTATWPDFNAFVNQHFAFIDSTADGLIGVRADDAQERLTQFEEVSDSYFDLAELIAQRHLFLHLLNVQTIPQNVKAGFILGDFGGVPFDSLPQVRDLVFKVPYGSNGDLGLLHIESGTGWETRPVLADRPFTDARARLTRTRPDDSITDIEARNRSALHSVRRDNTARPNHKEHAA